MYAQMERKYYMNLQGIVKCEVMEWIHLIQCAVLVNMVMNFQVS
jgi:hypothetical protein